MEDVASEVNRVPAFPALCHARRRASHRSPTGRPTCSARLSVNVFRTKTRRGLRRTGGHRGDGRPQSPRTPIGAPSESRGLARRKPVGTAGCVAQNAGVPQTASVEDVFLRVERSRFVTINANPAMNPTRPKQSYRGPAGFCARWRPVRKNPDALGSGPVERSGRRRRSTPALAIAHIGNARGRVDPRQ